MSGHDVNGRPQEGTTTLSLVVVTAQDMSGDADLFHRLPSRVDEVFVCRSTSGDFAKTVLRRVRTLVTQVHFAGGCCVYPLGHRYFVLGAQGDPERVALQDS